MMSRSTATMISPILAWDQLLEKTSGISFTGGMPASGCTHGADIMHGELIKGPLAHEIATSITEKDLREIMENFMPAVDEALQYTFTGPTMAISENETGNICKIIMKSLADKGPDFVPDVSDPMYLKVVTTCLAALGTEYLLEGKKQPNRQECYTKMSNVVAFMISLFEQDVASSIALDSTLGEDTSYLAAYFDKKNDGGCKCLKGYANNGVCAHCKVSKDKLLQCKRCKRCKMVAYCGRECQVSDWKRHKLVCKEKK